MPPRRTTAKPAPVDIDLLRMQLDQGKLVRVGVVASAQFPEGAVGRVRQIGDPAIDGEEFVQVEVAVGGAKDVLPFALSDLTVPGKRSAKTAASTATGTRDTGGTALAANRTRSTNGNAVAADQTRSAGRHTAADQTHSAGGTAVVGGADVAGGTALNVEGGKSSAPARPSVTGIRAETPLAQAIPTLPIKKTPTRSTTAVSAPSAARPSAGAPTTSAANSESQAARSARGTKPAAAPRSVASVAVSKPATGSGLPASNLEGIPSVTRSERPVGLSPASPSTGSRGRGRTAPVTITISSNGDAGDPWKVEARIGARVAVKSTVVSPARVWEIAQGLGDTPLIPVVERLLDDHRRITQSRVSQLAAELAGLQAELESLPPKGK